MIPPFLFTGKDARKSMNPFTGQLVGGEDGNTGSAADEMINALMDMLQRGQRDNRSDDRDNVRRAMAAVDPRRARVAEDFVRRRRRKDRADDGAAGRVIESYKRAGTARPPQSTFEEAGVTPEEVDASRAAGNAGRWRRQAAQMEKRLESGQKGMTTYRDETGQTTYIVDGKTYTDQAAAEAARAMSDEEKERKRNRIAELMGKASGVG